MRLFKVFLAIWLISSIGSAHACNSESPVHNDILDCLIEQYEPLDKQLNRLYQKKMATLSPKARLKLRQSQRQWVRARENTCVVDEKNYGRESHFEAMQCEIDMTKARIKFLKN